MRLINPVRNFLVDKAYYIDIYENHIHVFHYIDIIVLRDTEIRLQMEGFQLVLTGTDFCVKKLETQEILIFGFLRSLVMES